MQLWIWHWANWSRKRKSTGATGEDASAAKPPFPTKPEPSVFLQEARRRSAENYNFRRPRSMAIDSGTIARSGDGSTAPSEALDGGPHRQVGEQRHNARISDARPILGGRRISYSSPASSRKQMHIECVPYSNPHIEVQRRPDRQSQIDSLCSLVMSKTPFTKRR